MFTPSERQNILAQLLEALQQDARIVALVLVGSTATGFTDRYSDIDLVAVTAGEQPVAPVFETWVNRLGEMFSPWHHFQVAFDDRNFLAGFLLPGGLELDLGMVRLDALRAKKARWRVVYDRTGEVETRLQTSWEQRPPDDPSAAAETLTSVWHYVLQALISLQRGQLWRAVHNLEEVRSRGLQLAGLRRGLVVSHFREVDQLPEALKADFARTLVGRLETGEILRALRLSTCLFFREREALRPDPAARRLEAALLRLLDEASHSLLN